jgi:hypothetical protein
VNVPGLLHATSRGETVVATKGDPVLHLKGCMGCGLEIRFFDLHMNPKPPPDGPAWCSSCSIGKSVRT